MTRSTGASGRFITIEGGEGLGKSTQCALLADVLRGRGQPVVLTREPGGTALGEAVRAVLLDRTLPPMGATAELLLVFAARAEHLERVIRPALAAGTHVICDRFVDATYAYQGGGRGLDPADIACLERLVLRGMAPDLTLILDAPVSLGAARIAARGGQDRFEAEHTAFFERVRATYRARAAATPARYRLIDASGTLEDVHARVAAAVASWWP